jgi:hypothetical protein
MFATLTTYGKAGVHLLFPVVMLAPHDFARTVVRHENAVRPLHAQLPHRSTRGIKDDRAGEEVQQSKEQEAVDEDDGKHHVVDVVKSNGFEMEVATENMADVQLDDDEDDSAEPQSAFASAAVVESGMRWRGSKPKKRPSKYNDDEEDDDKHHIDHRRRPKACKKCPCTHWELIVTVALCIVAAAVMGMFGYLVWKTDQPINNVNEMILFALQQKESLAATVGDTRLISSRVGNWTELVSVEDISQIRNNTMATLNTAYEQKDNVVAMIKDTNNTLTVVNGAAANLQKQGGFTIQLPMFGSAPSMVDKPCTSSANEP